MKVVLKRQLGFLVYIMRKQGILWLFNTWRARKRRKDEKDEVFREHIDVAFIITILARIKSGTLEVRGLWSYIRTSYSRPTTVTLLEVPIRGWSVGHITPPLCDNFGGGRGVTGHITYGGALLTPILSISNANVTF